MREPRGNKAPIHSAKLRNRASTNRFRASWRSGFLSRTPNPIRQSAPVNFPFINPTESSGLLPATVCTSGGWNHGGTTEKGPRSTRRAQSGRAATKAEYGWVVGAACRWDKMEVYEKTIPITERHAGPICSQAQDYVIGMLQGFDRLRLQGTLRALYFPRYAGVPWQAKVLWKDFKSFATGLTQRMRAEIESLAREAQRPVLYLPSSQTRKETLAKEIAQRDAVEQGLVAVFSCVEACRGLSGGG